MIEDKTNNGSETIYSPRKTEMEHGHACLLARVTIIAFDGSRILVPLAVIVWANWMKGQVIVGCIYSRISTSKLHKTPTQTISDMCTGFLI